MKKRAVTLATVALALSATQAWSAAPCDYDRAAMMSLAPHDFDEGEHAGWRLVGDRPGCEVVGADLIADYRRTKAADVAVSDARSLRWHEAQLRAAAGQNHRAIALMEAARPDNDVERNLYIDASIAFLRHDRVSLLDIQSRYLALPKPDWFDGAAVRFQSRYGRALVWPPNGALVDRFAACPEAPYRPVYNGACPASVR